jgi:hypothetical protein
MITVYMVDIATGKPVLASVKVAASPRLDG